MGTHKRLVFVVVLVVFEAAMLVELGLRPAVLQTTPLIVWAAGAPTIDSRARRPETRPRGGVVPVTTPPRAREPVAQLPLQYVERTNWNTLPLYSPAVSADVPALDAAFIATTGAALTLALPPGPVAPQVPAVTRGRTAGFPGLYASFATLQVLDAVSTWRAVQFGNARELNPLVTGVAESLPALIAMKVGSTAVSIYAVEKLRKRNRKAAVATMIGINVAYAYVVSRNFEVVRANRRRSDTP